MAWLWEKIEGKKKRTQHLWRRGFELSSQLWTQRMSYRIWHRWGKKLRKEEGKACFLKRRLYQLNRRRAPYQRHLHPCLRQPALSRLVGRDTTQRHKRTGVTVGWTAPLLWLETKHVLIIRGGGRHGVRATWCRKIFLKNLQPKGLQHDRCSSSTKLGHEWWVQGHHALYNA